MNPRFPIPALVRIKPGAIARLGIYLGREARRRIAFFSSDGLAPAIVDPCLAALSAEGIGVAHREAVLDNSFEHATALFAQLSPSVDAIVGLGGGKALDVAKYVAFLAGKPCYAVPTSLSNDGFCSPQSSLTVGGRRRSLPAALPAAIVVDLDVCAGAPEVLWHSGVGDIVAKATAIRDWKLAFHADGTPVNDFAALLSDATFFQFMARPTRDAEGIRLLATALMLNGIAMEICGSSRPASGSEHLVSHALDMAAARPRLHGLQVGVAAYICSILQGSPPERVGAVLEATGFWKSVHADPFSRAEWLAAFRAAPAVKPGFYTVLSSRDCVPEVANLLESDPRLALCFRP